jgi:hypothetical protein
MDMDGQASCMMIIGKIHKALEKLCVEHSNDKIETAVIIGDYSKERRFTFSDGR